MLPGDTDKKVRINPKIDFQKMGVGLVFALSFFMIAIMLNGLFPKINEYAFLILLVIIVKATGWLPKYYEESAVTFSSSITKNNTCPIGWGWLTKLDLVILTHSLTWQFVLLVLTSLIQFLLKIACGNYLDFTSRSAITAGINNSMGGAGNISVWHL